MVGSLIVETAKAHRTKAPLADEIAGRGVGAQVLSYVEGQVVKKSATLVLRALVFLAAALLVAQPLSWFNTHRLVPLPAGGGVLEAPLPARSE